MLENLRQIERYFVEYGWAYEQIDTETLVSGLQGENAQFRLFVKFDDNWVYFTLLLFASKPRLEYQERVYAHLLQHNYEMNMVKAGIDEDSDIFLAVKLPVSDLDFAHFFGALDALSYYADKYYLPTLNLAIGPAYRSVREG